VIFAGQYQTIPQGSKTDAVTTYLDIMAADGDVAYNNSFISRTLAAGHTPISQMETSLAAMNEAQKNAAAANVQLPDITSNPAEFSPGGVLPAARGKTMFGMARDVFKQQRPGCKCSWSIQNGQIQVIPVRFVSDDCDYCATVAIYGLVNIPEATDQGVKVKILFEPEYRVGCLVKIARELDQSDPLRTG